MTLNIETHATSIKGLGTEMCRRIRQNKASIRIKIITVVNLYFNLK